MTDTIVLRVASHWYTPDHQGWRDQIAVLGERLHELGSHGEGTPLRVEAGEPDNLDNAKGWVEVSAMVLASAQVIQASAGVIREWVRQDAGREFTLEIEQDGRRITERARAGPVSRRCGRRCSRRSRRTSRMTTRDTEFKALAVGNAWFPKDPRLTPLKGPLNDVDAVCEVLADAETGLFRCQAPLKDESAQTVKETIEDFFNAASANECLLFYYSGHGRVDRDNEFYLCAKDTRSQNSASPRITGVELAKFVQQSPALLKIIILDCCYASEFKGGDVWTPQYFTGKGRLVLAATRGVGSPLVPDAPTADA